MLRQIKARIEDAMSIAQERENFLLGKTGEVPEDVPVSLDEVNGEIIGYCKALEILEQVKKELDEITNACCPKCGSTGIVGEGVEITLKGAEQEVGCDNCGAGWYDDYVYVGHTLIEEES